MYKVYIVSATSQFAMEVSDGELDESGWTLRQFQLPTDEDDFYLCIHRIDTAPAPRDITFEVTSLGAAPYSQGQFVEQDAVLAKNFTSSDSNDFITFEEIVRSGNDLLLMSVDGNGTYVEVLKDNCNVSATSPLYGAGSGTAFLQMYNTPFGALQGARQRYEDNNSTPAYSGVMDKGTKMYVRSNVVPTDSTHTCVSVRATKVHDNAKQSTDFGNREILSTVHMTANYDITSTNWEKIPFSTAIVNKGGIFNSALSRVDITESGDYDLDVNSYFASFTAGNKVGVSVYVNGVGGGYNNKQWTPSETDTYLDYQKILSLNAGDYVEIYVKNYTAIGGTLYSSTAYFTLAKRSTPQTMLDSPKVFAEYSQTYQQSIPHGTWTRINYNIKDYSSESMVTTGEGTWALKLPSNGNYTIVFNINFVSTTWASGDLLSMKLITSEHGTLYGDRTHQTGVTAEVAGFSTVDIIGGKKDEIIYAEVYQAASSSLLLSNNADFNRITLTKQ